MSTIEAERSPEFSHDPKLNRARIIMNPRNMEYNPKKRVVALIELAMDSNMVPIDPDDPLMSKGLILFMPGQPKNLPIDMWYAIREKEVESLLRENPKDAKKERYYLIKDTEEYESSFYMAEAKHLSKELIHADEAQKAEMAIRLMYSNAAELVKDEIHTDEVNEYFANRRAQALGHTSLNNN